MRRLYISSMFMLGVMVFLFLFAKPSFAACPVNMVQVGPICVDKFEASVWSRRPDSAGNPRGTQYGADANGDFVVDVDYPCLDNGNDCKKGTPGKIFAVSAPGKIPSAFITWFQAQQACLNVGKRLLTNAEWQGAAAGTPTDYEPGADDGMDDCNTSTANTVVPTGSRSNCVSNFGAFDMVGNLFEWVADWIQGSTDPFEPSAGTAGSDFGDDFMLGTNPAVGQGVNSSNFPAALIRGGRFNGGTGAGVFALNAFGAPSSSPVGIGFRCAR